MLTESIKQQITAGALDAHFASLYGAHQIEAARTRYLEAVASFEHLFGTERDAFLFSVPGRSELSGNHTDHTHGRVIAASIDLDVIAVASPTDNGIVRIKSEGFPEDTVPLAEAKRPKRESFGTSAAIIAGMAVGVENAGFSIGGFDAYTTSNVLKGSGLSSSAAFENMVGTIFSHLYNNGRIDNVQIAKLSQYAENVFFGKPCGLMDQVACAVGGIVAIDFADPSRPQIEALDFDLSGQGYNLCIVNTGGNHADLTDDYAAVPAEMKAVAAHFGKNVLREVKEEQVVAEIPALRHEVGDRAILRALHFFRENDRVEKQVAALKSNNIDAFFDGVLASGRSSFCYLQNVYTVKNVREQGLSLALCLCERFLAGEKAAYRVHGGGFAGTVQAFVPDHLAKDFRASMDAAFGQGACLILRIRRDGAVRIL